MSILLLLLIGSVLPLASLSYSVPCLPTRRCAMTMRKARPKGNSSNARGKGMGSGASFSKGGGVSASKPGGSVWMPVSGLKSISDLPRADEDGVKIVDTMVSSLIVPRTNPTGAVSVATHGGDTFCFGASCPSCQIPMTKAKILPPNEDTDDVNPRVACNFCGSTYNIRTGDRVADSGKTGGILGGAVRGLFSANKDDKPLPTYGLGEKDGRVLIRLQ